jgi:hypothetical protein
MYVSGNNKILYVFFWVISRRLNFISRRFGTLYLFHLHRQEIYLRLHIEGSIYLSDFNQMRKFFDRFSQNSPKSNFTEFRPAGTAAIHADRRSDGRT